MTLLANSEAAIWAATFGGNPRFEPKCLTGFRVSSGMIVNFVNSVVLWRHTIPVMAAGSPVDVDISYLRPLS